MARGQILVVSGIPLPSCLFHTLHLAPCPLQLQQVGVQEDLFQLALTCVTRVPLLSVWRRASGAAHLAQHQPPLQHPLLHPLQPPLQLLVGATRRTDLLTGQHVVTSAMTTATVAAAIQSQVACLQTIAWGTATEATMPSGALVLPWSSERPF